MSDVIPLSDIAPSLPTGEPKWQHWLEVFWIKDRRRGLHLATTLDAVVDFTRMRST